MIFELVLTQYMGGSLLYLWGTTQGHERGEGKSKPEMGLQSLGQGSRIRPGRVGQGQDVEFQKWKLRFVERQDTWWKILE